MRVGKLHNPSAEEEGLKLLAQLFLDVMKEQPEVFEKLRELFDKDDH